MSELREIRTYDYVNHPYEMVRDALVSAPSDVFGRATRSAGSRARSIAAGLSINIGSIEVGTDIDLTAGAAEETEGASDTSRTTRIPIEWQASKHTQLFPFMKAVLSIYPITATETQLDFVGSYEPPFGMMGNLIDSVAGRRIAEAAIHRFVSDTADYLRQTLA